MLLVRKCTEPSPNRKFAPARRVHAVKRVGVVERVVGAGHVRGIAVAQDQGLAVVRIVVGGAVGFGRELEGGV